ncbi:uncharacterized protein [Nothobranchius furzeri]|uniref:uncharacterized protein isoform X3 n=1 Tax=Nothobranchius furzeri TaxID=105023 RepID=UPI003904AF8A
MLRQEVPSECSQFILSSVHTSEVFHLVEFTVNKTVAVVPENWYSDGVTCWPNYKSDASVNRAKEPGPEVETYDVRILKSCDQYFEARQHLNKSRHATLPTCRQKKRKRTCDPRGSQRRFIFGGDSDDSEDEHPRKKSRSQSKTSVQPPAPAVPPPPSPAVEPSPCQQQTLSASQVHTLTWRGRRFDYGHPSLLCHRSPDFGLAGASKKTDGATRSRGQLFNQQAGCNSPGNGVSMGRSLSTRCHQKHCFCGVPPS